MGKSTGERGIYRTGDGRLRGAVSWTDATGKRQRRYVSGSSKAEVRRELAKLRDELDRGLEPMPVGTVEEFLAAWLEASRANVRASTWRGYEQCVRGYIVPAFGRRELRKLLPTDVERMTAAMIAEGRSPTTARLARTVLRLALATALRDGLVHRNVAALARPPYMPTRTLTAGRDYLTAADLGRLVSSVRLHPVGPLVTVAAATGLRQGELLGLEWSDIDLDAGTLTVRRALARDHRGGWSLTEPKTARSRRTVDLPATATAALQRQQSVQDGQRERAGSAWQDRDGLVFTDELGRPLSGSWVTHRFHDMLDAAGLPSIPFHGLRHSAATAMLAAGVPLKVVSEALGHATITITADRYAGVVPAQRKDAAAAMERALGGGAS